VLKVIGLGNTLRGDDGIGPKIIELLNEKKYPAPLFTVDAGADAFTVLEHLILKEPILIIDCAEMGKEPGEIVNFTLNDVTIQSIEKAVSLHSFGFGEVYQMAKSMGKIAKCNIIGVQPKQIEFNTGISSEVEASIPKIINWVIKEAKKYAG
jgi:hydrogenase maturation protease